MRTPQNIEMQRGFKVGDARDFITRTVAIDSVPDGAQDPLWSAKEFEGNWTFCTWVGPCPCCALMQLTSGTWHEHVDGKVQVTQAQIEDVVEVEACICPGPGGTFRLKGEYGREGNTNRFVQTLPQFENNRGTTHLAPGDTIEFKDFLNSEFHFASLTSDNLMDGPGGQPQAENRPVTVAAKKCGGKNGCTGMIFFCSGDRH